jgi:hypothetical protein
MLFIPTDKSLRKSFPACGTDGFPAISRYSVIAGLTVRKDS